MAEELFDREAVLAHLRALADHLTERKIPHQSIVLIGGSYLALRDLSRSTRDIDTITRLDATTRKAIADVGAARGLSSDWLNDHAAAFRPDGLSLAETTSILEHPALTVLAPTARWVFLMKLFAARTIDYDDMVALWPDCDFESADEAVAAYRDAYPHAPEDEYLVEYVRDIASRARK